ncbi:NAD(P)/FAD-dependent oxidoreductase [Sulfitobacter mediterraneus]|uniref:NAD(P)/FAD-dependent oxidoreductase n=1 Tax=Sulfitobacter mediterraneus TaxID=83219 RepID=UPI0013C3FE26|nr:FAD-binding oxidoreductase [Sulfitobacter mediterraneus]
MPAFPFRAPMPQRFAGAIPEAVDVVVIGGGVIGVTTALYLARDGHRVALLEKGRIAAEQSSRNWGWIRQQGRDPDELPIMMEAIGLWQDLAADCAVDIGLHQGGVTYFAETEKDLSGFANWQSMAADHDLDTRMLSPREAAALFPDMGQRYKGAMVTPSDMRAEPWLAVPALADLAAAEGVDIVENCAVRCLDLAGGKVAGVVAESGRIAAPRVVLAAGAWSSLFLRNHGVSLPQLSVRESVLSTAPLPHLCEGAAADSKVAFRRRADGGYTLAPTGVTELFIGPDALRHFGKYLTQLWANPLGQSYHLAAPAGYPDGWGTKRRWTADEQSPFERMRILDPAPNIKKLDRLVEDFAALFPALPEVKVSARWAGMIDTMPDVVPVVDHCDALPGLVIGTGMSGHGFGIGPAMGRVLAALVTGDPLGHDLDRFRAARFTDGSAIRLGPSV